MTDSIETPVVSRDSPPGIRITSNGIGRSVQVRVIDMPSSGYVWALAHMTGRMLLDEIERLETPQPDDPLDFLFGTDRERIFYFSPREIGPAVIQFELVRPWLPNEIEQRVILTVITDE